MLKNGSKIAGVSEHPNRVLDTFNQSIETNLKKKMYFKFVLKACSAQFV